jgi:hypothetical protein
MSENSLNIHERNRATNENPMAAWEAFLRMVEGAFGGNRGSNPPLVADAARIKNPPANLCVLRALCGESL